MKKILIIDDDKATSKLLAKSIREELGVETDVSELYPDAVSKLQAGKDGYDLVISGLVLPESTNGEMVEWCLKNRVPVIVLTASFDDDTRRRYAEKAVFDYIIKRDKDAVEETLRSVRRAIRNSESEALVADDSAVFRKLIRDILESQLFRVHEANNGSEALKLVKAIPNLSLVLTDYDMPETDGFQLTLELRKFRSKESLAIIALSGLDDADIVPKFLKYGANDYIIKPFKREEFVSRVNLNMDNIDLIRTIRSMAHLDPVTGLFNRKYFYEIGKVLHSNAQRNGYQLSVAVSDINSGGLDGADLALAEKKFAKLVNERLKRRSDVAARIAPGLFAVITEGQNVDDLFKLFAELRKSAADGQGLDPVVGILAKMEADFEGTVDKAAAMLAKARLADGGEKVWVE